MKDLMITLTVVVPILAFVVYFGACYTGEHKKERDKKYNKIEAATILALFIIFGICMCLISYIYNKVQ